MSVERFEYEDGDLLVAEVLPSLVPPVRYRGRTFIRIGPRKDIASEAEERILLERRTSYMATLMPHLVLVQPSKILIQILSRESIFLKLLMMKF